jgi:hypothetical protein
MSRPKVNESETIEIELCSMVITIDKEDHERILQWQWRLDNSTDVIRICKDLPVPQLLTGFLLGVDPAVYVVQAKPWAWNFSKSNLTVSQRSAIKPKGKEYEIESSDL